MPPTFRSIDCVGDWMCFPGVLRIAVVTELPLDGVSSARGGGPPYQLAVELRLGPRAPGRRLPAGGGGPNPRRLGQVEVGRVQAEPGRGREPLSGLARSRQQEQQQRDARGSPAPSPRRSGHRAARAPPSAAARGGLAVGAPWAAPPSGPAPRASAAREPAAWGRLLSRGICL